MALAALQVVAVATTMAAWLPQALVGLRRGTTTGVSRSAWLIAAVLGAVWSAYGAMHGVWMLAASEGVFALGSVVVLCTLVTPLRAVVGVAAGVVVAVVCVVALPASAFAVAGVCASVSVRAAQVVRILRRQDATGVADLSWWMLTLALVCWGAFGVMADKPPLVLGSVAGVLSSVAVVVLSRRYQTTA